MGKKLIPSSAVWSLWCSVLLVNPADVTQTTEHDSSVPATNVCCPTTTYPAANSCTTTAASTKPHGYTNPDHYRAGMRIYMKICAISYHVI